MDLEDENDKIDEYILKCLVKNGWYMGRNVDVSCYDDVLKEEGYVINKHAYDILKEWGGLYIRNLKKVRMKNYILSGAFKYTFFMSD